MTSNEFKERLTPSFGSYLAMTLIFPMAFLAALPFGFNFAMFLALFSTALLLGLVTLASPAIAIGEVFTAGRFTLPLDALGRVEVFIGEAARMARGPDLDARAKLMIRGDIGGLVRVWVEDSSDPTPYLLISSRRPEELARALGADFPIL